MDTSSWPPSLKSFVERCFAVFTSRDERLYIQTYLKDIIGRHVAAKTIWTHPWHTEPVPGPNGGPPPPANPAALPDVVSLRRELVSDREARRRKDETAKEAAKARAKRAKLAKRARAQERVQGISAQLNRKTTYTPASVVAEAAPVEPPSKKAKKKPGIEAITISSAERAKRAARFDLANEDGGGVSDSGNGWDDGEDEFKAEPVVGTCTKLEKSYFRLTGAPVASSVRPPDVLRAALDRLQVREYEYEYLCDQLKAIRQDMTVQGVRDELAVDVYEFHARAALRADDLGEFNQCQTQLIELYTALHLERPEFVAYRLLYFVVTDSSVNITRELGRLSPSLRDTEAVRHALAVREAVTMGDWVTLQHLSQDRVAPNLSRALVDHVVADMRRHTFECIVKSFRPTVSLQWVAEQVGMDRVRTLSTLKVEYHVEVEEGEVLLSRRK